MGDGERRNADRRDVTIPQGTSTDNRDHPEEEEPFLTAEEAAAYLKVHERTLYRLMKAGKLPGVRVGRQWRYRKSVLDAWMARALVVVVVCVVHYLSH